MEAPIVEVKEGKLKGSQRVNLDEENFYSFLGIPFAKPPIKELRFGAPRPSDPWLGVRDATIEANHCIQRNEITLTITGSEDCLYLNVFTKKLPSEESILKPVMVWIHGGALVIGSNNTQYYGPEHLLTEDIVLVTINYRLGFLGFLSVEDLSLNVPNDVGMQDQQQALKWVQRNINSFNGDPNNVTIFGESAGGYSVHYHLLSPSSKDLFHKAIIQSGCLLCPWSQPIMKDLAVKLAQFIDADVTTEKNAIEILRNVSDKDFYETQNKFFEKYGNYGMLYPNINNSINPIKKTEEVISEGRYNKVPLLLGYTNREGILVDIAKKYELFGKMFDKEFDLESFVTFDEGDPRRDVAVKKLKDLYCEGENAKDKYLLSSDVFFTLPTITAAHLHAKTSNKPVYLYRVSIDAGLNFWKRHYDMTHVSGASHCDELGYLFNVAFAADKMKKGVTELLAVKRFVKLWTNFAKYGNPTPKGNDLNVTWKPVEFNINYLDIGESLRTLSNPALDRLQVWKEIGEL